MVDEAHAAGVLGARGAGTCELFGLEADVDLRMGTFSKSLASCGGFIAGPHEVIDFLRISSRAFLFTASNVPAAVGAALAALRIVRSPEGPELFARAELKRQVAEGEASVAEIVLSRPWEAESMTIADLLMSQHRWGRTRCRRFLASIPMSETKTVGSMTARQRRALAARLRGDIAETAVNG